jgi:Holliday junction resolvase RusA-like endonuclease
MEADPDITELYFPLDRPLFIRCRFYLPRPKRPRWELPAVKPDGDKLLRAIQDALTDTPERTTRGKRPRTIPAQPGVVVDDSRFVSGTYTKYYSDAPGASITIGEIF